MVWFGDLTPTAAYEAVVVFGGHPVGVLPVSPSFCWSTEGPRSKDIQS